MAKTNRELSAEEQRLADAQNGEAPWRKWGPYLSERQWGTVREDYSQSGDAWAYFSHDQARSRAYRWGEDGLAGVSDDYQLLCFALALWNQAGCLTAPALEAMTISWSPFLVTSSGASRSMPDFAPRVWRIT